MDNLKHFIKADVYKLSQQRRCSTAQKLMAYDIDQWLNDRPKRLLDHITELCDLKIVDLKDKYLMVKIIE